MSRKKSRSVWLLTFTTLVCAGALGGGVWIAKRNAIPKIELKPLPPLPNPNGFDLYYQAARAIRQANPPVDPNQGDGKATGVVAARLYSLKRRKAWLKNNAAGFAIFDAALQAQSRHPDPATDGMGFRYFKNYAQYRVVARDKEAQINTLKMDKRPAAALNAALDVVQMSFDVRRGAHQLGSYSTYAVTLLGLEPVQDTDNLPEQLSAPEARAAIARLEKLMAKRPPLSEMVSMTHRQTLAGLRDLWARPNWRNVALDIVKSQQREVTTRENWRVRSAAPAEILNNVELFYRAADAMAKLPYSQRMNYQWPDTDEFDPVSQLWCVPLRPHLIFDETKEKVALDLLLLRLALQAHKLETGAYPATLNALQGTYLARIPTDAFADGKPFRYTLAGGTYKLWSIGPDGVDNGGAPTPWPNKTTAPASNKHWPPVMLERKGDWVARANR